MTTDSEIETALGLLINLSGKMRMLSHRVVMSGLQATLAPSTRDGALRTYEAALIEFRAIHEALHKGSESYGVPAEAAEALLETAACPPEAENAVARFLGEADQLAENLQAGTCDASALSGFACFVADDLLAALNTITDGVNRALQARLDRRAARAAHAREAMMSAVSAIGDVAMKVKLISLNATIEAARAGDHGRSFAVIAKEIRTLSEDAARSSEQIASHLRTVA